MSMRSTADPGPVTSDRRAGLLPSSAARGRGRLGGEGFGESIATQQLTLNQWRKLFAIISDAAKHGSILKEDVIETVVKTVVKAKDGKGLLVIKFCFKTSGLRK